MLHVYSKKFLILYGTLFVYSIISLMLEGTRIELGNALHFQLLVSRKILYEYLS